MGVHLSDTSPTEFDLSVVELVPKYEQEIKIAPNKLKDLLSLTKYMGDDQTSEWIRTLYHRQQKLGQPTVDEDEDEDADEQGGTDPDELDRIFERDIVNRLN